MAWTLALVVAGLTAAQPTSNFDLDGPRAEASARGRAFATLGRVPFADLQAQGRGQASLEVQQRIGVDAATYGDLASFRASATFGSQRVEVELIEAGLPPGLREEVAVAPPPAIEGGVALDTWLHTSSQGLSAHLTPVNAAISVWGVGRVSLDGRVLTERALVHVTALAAGARSDDGRFQQLPGARPGDLELGVLALGVPELGFVQLGFDGDVQIAREGVRVPSASVVELEDAFPYRSLDGSAQAAQNRAQGAPDPGPTPLRPASVPPNALERPVLDAEVVMGGSGAPAVGGEPSRAGASDQVVELADSAEEAVAQADGAGRPGDAPRGAAQDGAFGGSGEDAVGAAADDVTGRRQSAPGGGVQALTPVPGTDRMPAPRFDEGAVLDAEGSRADGPTARSPGPAGERRSDAAEPSSAGAPEGSGRIIGIRPAQAEVAEDDAQVQVTESGLAPANAVSAERGNPVLQSGIAPANARTPDQRGMGTLQSQPLSEPLIGQGEGIAPLQSGIAPLGATGEMVEINDGTSRSTVTFGPGVRGGAFGPGVGGAGGLEAGQASATSAAGIEELEGTAGTGVRAPAFVPGVMPLNAAPATGLPQGIQPLNAQPAAPAR